MNIYIVIMLSSVNDSIKIAVRYLIVLYISEIIIFHHVNIHYLTVWLRLADKSAKKSCLIDTFGW